MKVIVVGAGVLGTWIALSLAKSGYRVTLLDQAGPGNEFSSSAGESRIIRSAYGPEELYTAMAQRALRLWTDFFHAEGQRDCFRKTGVLWIAPSGEPSIWQARAIFAGLGISHDWLDADAIAERFGQFEVTDDAVALWEPEAGAILAERSIAALMSSAMNSGIAYEKAQVFPPALRGSRLRSIVAADGRCWEADYFVFACGSWLPKLFADLAGLISPTRQELFFFTPPKHSVEFAEGALPIWIDQTDTNIAYGFPDFGNGVKLGFHRLGPSFDPDTPRQSPSAEAITEASVYMARRFPGLRGAAVKTTRVCHYENTPTGDFLIDVHPGADNLWLVGGGSGHAFKHAPVIAEYLMSLFKGDRAPENRFSLMAKTQASARVL